MLDKKPIGVARITSQDSCQDDDTFCPCSHKNKLRIRSTIEQKMHIVGAIFLAIAIAASPVKSDDCSQLDYCGGWHGDLGTEISCTPFPAKSKGIPPYQWAGFCNNSDLVKYAGSSSGAKAWQSDGADDYWVFHGCDGAGLMDDCMGGKTYVEQFGPYSNEQTPWNIHQCSGGWERHCTQPFVHPGTGKVYDWLNAGQLTYGGGKWPDQVVNKPWWNSMGLPDTDQLDNGPGTAFAIMYPWVCNYSDDNKLGWLWGQHTPYGDNTYKTKCYYDNEPWDNDHCHSVVTPPIWQAYKFHYDDSTQVITGWKLAEKLADHNEPVYYYLTESPAFELQSVGSPPWMAEE
jgi:hypothetical protein